MSKLNKDGQTEDEFLIDYKNNADIYPRPSYCADVIVFSLFQNKPVVLLIRRGNHPFIGHWAIPGGFVNQDEPSEKCAQRELEEETGLKNITAEQLVTVSTPDRDPRGWNISTVYLAVIESPIKTAAGDDASDAGWFYVDFAASANNYVLTLTNTESGEQICSSVKVKRTRGLIDLNETVVHKQGNIAFDHAKLILYALEKL